jgi:hypothetical protein
VAPLFILLGLAASTLIASCARSVPRDPARRDALLVVPGFGYDDDAARAIRATDKAFAAEGIDLFVAGYLRRKGIAASRDALLEIYREQGLDRYERVHVFAFIAGSWTLNPALADGQMPNVATVIYDRSPYQERAPRIAMDRLRIPTRLFYGNVLFDVARAPYPPLDPGRRRVGILVETRPTGFIKRFAGTAAKYGPFDFRCNAFSLRYDDCAYIDMSHDDLYVKFSRVVPEIVGFIRNGRFTAGANRAPPVRDSTRVAR